MRLLATLLCCVSVLAAGFAPPSSTAVDELDSALEARDYRKAEPLIRARVDRGDRDPTLLYNHACVLAQLGRLKDAEAQLLASIKAGFRDFAAMEADPDLEPIRDSETYGAIMEARARIESERGSGTPADPSVRRRRAPAPDPVAQWKKDHPEPLTDKTGYRYEDDPDSSITYATFLDAASHARMTRMLGDLERHLLRAYFGKPPNERLLVAIVRPGDAGKYLDRPEVRGMYLHSARRLVSRDTGQSLQHEFVHLMHFAALERTGQRHPMWVQEGLASLYEDYTLAADGSIEFHPNIRFNYARKQVLADASMRWDQLFALSNEEFMREAERLYPQVRAIFEFLARERKLEEFYRQLCRTWDDDPDGSSAMEKTFGEPLARIEDRWKKWIRTRGEVDDQIDGDDASFGFVALDAGDGIAIKEFRPRSAARAAGLRVGDVVFEVGGVPVRNRDELLLAVARLSVGTPVVVRYRRDGRESSVEIAPRPRDG